MRTTIIPAQITTLEDKIAGSLNVIQILILMIPIVLTSLVYALIPPTMSLTPSKLTTTLVSLIVCVALVVRVKDKIIAQWLGVLTRYLLRPRLYLFDKNDLTYRTPDFPAIKGPPHPSKKTLYNRKKPPHQDPSIADLIKLEELLSKGNVAVSFRVEGKRQ